MKKNILSLALMALMSVPVFAQNQSMAEAEKINGVFVFTDSRPVTEYEYLGVVHQTFWATEYIGTRNRLIRKAKKKYPECDAVIIRTSSWERDQADVIKFK
jgi:hypothetical protein